VHSSPAPRAAAPTYRAGEQRAVMPLHGAAAIRDAPINALLVPGNLNHRRIRSASSGRPADLVYLVRDSCRSNGGRRSLDCKSRFPKAQRI